MNELGKAIKKVRLRKAAGENKVTADLLKYLDEKSRKYLLKLLNQIYLQGILPEGFKKSTFIPIPKPTSTK